MNVRSCYDPALFEGTAKYYALFRPPYPPKLFEHIVCCFRLDTTGRALDLGCGTGQLALPLAPHFEEVVCMDPDASMLDEARHAAVSARVANLRFVLGSSWDLSTSMGQFRLVTMGESFHWMDRDAVLQTLHEMVSVNGGVVVVSRHIETPQAYQIVLDKVLKGFLGDRRRAGEGFYSHPAERHEVVLARSRFIPMTPWVAEYQQTFSIDEIIGFLYSTSYASRRLFGDRVHSFEQEMRRQLLELDSNGSFRFRIVVTALLAARP